MQVTKRALKRTQLQGTRCELASVYWSAYASFIQDEGDKADSELFAAASRRQSVGQPLAVAKPNLRQFLDNVRDRAKLAAVVGQIPQLRAIASELFLDEITFEIDEDPEIDGRNCLVVTVSVTADLEEVAKRRREWYNHITGLLGQECELVQLVVNVND